MLRLCIRPFCMFHVNDGVNVDVFWELLAESILINQFSDLERSLMFRTDPLGGLYC